MLFKKLVEQHRVHRVVANGVDLAVLVTLDKVWVHGGYFLGDQSKLWRVCFVALVVKRHRLQRQDRFAGGVHWLNLLFEPTRRTDRGELTGGGDKDLHHITRHWRAEDTAYPSRAIHVISIGVETGNVGGSRVILERINTDSCILVANTVASERVMADGRILIASAVVLERRFTDSRVEVAGGVVQKG